MRFRVFAALELPPENQERLGEVLAGLQEAVPPGSVRWVRPAAMHLTLKFYGDVDRERLPALGAVLTEAACQAPRLHLTMAGLGVFPNARRPQVIWAGVGGELEPLLALQADLEARSEALGFAPEGRAYKPHLTLGRVNGALRPVEQQQLLQGLKARRDDVFGPLEAEALSLMRSDLRPEGAVYTQLLAAPLRAVDGWGANPAE